MSDIQSKIAARRAELAQNEKDQKARQVAAETKRQVAQQQQEQAALDCIATDLSAGGVTVKRDGDELVIVDAPLPPLDVEGMKRSGVDRLLKREARKRWTPAENWLVIGFIVGGICLIHLSGFGLVPLLIGLSWGQAVNKKHRADVQEAYPGIFAAA